MNSFFKNTKRFSIIFAALILTITLAAGSLAVATSGLSPQQAVAGDDEPDMLNGGMSFAAAPDAADETGGLEDLPVKEMSFNIPAEMNGVYLVPGEDFIKSPGDSADAVKNQISDAVDAVGKSNINTVIIDTVYGDKVIYSTKDSPSKFEDFDPTGYITEKCRENGLYVYALFDVSHYDNIQSLDANASEFAAKYKLDGILADGYEGKSDDSGYGEYIKSGGSMGYDNFKNEAAASRVKAISKAVRREAPDTHTGLLANPVWANITDNKDGSDTKAEYTSLISGFADTKSYIELGWFDFVAVKAGTMTSDKDVPFGEVASWWSRLAAQKAIPMYIVYPSSKIGSNGWTSSSIDEQKAFAANETAYGGGIFDSFKNAPAAASAIPAAPTKADSADAASIIKPVSTAAPEKAPETVSALGDAGQADELPWEGYQPEFEDGPEEESDDESGSLNGNIIKSISPMGVLTGEYGEDITIKAIALEDSVVMATLNGETIELSLDTGYKSAAAGYGLFTGIYTVSGDDEEYDGNYGGQFLGALSVYANLEGREEIVDGAYLAAAKTSKSRYPVQVTADQARIYPSATRNMVPVASMYPLPKGATDYAIGKPVTVKDASGVKYTHLILESGMRIDASDVKEVNSGPKNNSITSLSVSEKSGYTYISIKTRQKVTYAVSYNTKEMTITFANTTSVPSRSAIASNRMFSGAKWSGKNKLTLTLAKNGGFMGFKGYYDGDSLVFRFNQPPSSIKNAKIYVDPGHGGSDVGAYGKNPLIYEKDITAALAKKLVAELKSRGATVKMYDQRQNIRMPERVLEAEKWGADMIISVHCNSSVNPAAKGTEVYYFYPFSRQLAINTSLNASKQFASTNRGAKQSYYHITLSPQMQSVMVETGFLSNVSDYSKLRKASYHQRLAVGIANGIEGALKTAYTGKVSNGTEFKSPNTAASSGNEDKSASGDEKITSVKFSGSTAKIKIGQTMTLKPVHTPSSIKDVKYTWKTSSSSTVSVNDNGTVKGLKAGTATITATANDGSKQKASIRVTVSNESANSQPAIDVSGAALSSIVDAYIDEEYIMVYPGNKQRVEIFSEQGKVIRGADFKWASSDSNVATVDENGVVTAKAVGYTNITATGGKYTFKCEIEVSKTTVAVKGIELGENSIVMVKNTSRTLRAAVLPKSATDKSIRWSSSNDKIAEISANGVIVAKNAGKVTITARTNTGGYKAVCSVQVLNKAIELEEIVPEMDEIEMGVGGTDVIYVDYIPGNTTSDLGVTFTSNKPNVVSVDNGGNIKALAKGTAKITITSKANKNLTTVCTVTVV